MKRFLITADGKTIEGVVFSDGTIVINGGVFKACIMSQDDINRIFAGATLHQLDEPTGKDVIIMGKPSKGTPADKRLAANKPKPATGKAMPPAKKAK
jgi:hypothetical protein